MPIFWAVDFPVHMCIIQEPTEIAIVIVVGYYGGRVDSSRWVGYALVRGGEINVNNCTKVFYRVSIELMG